MEIKTKGIVLRSFRKGENDNISVIFTREAGKLLASSKGTSKPGGKLRPSLEKCSLSDFSFTKKNKGSEFCSLVSAKIITQFEGLRSSPAGLGFSMQAIELLDRFLELEGPEAGLFDMTEDVFMAASNAKPGQTGALRAYFKVNLLKLLGFDILKLPGYIDGKSAPRAVLDGIKAAGEAGSTDEAAAISGPMRGINGFIDSYIVNVLGREVLSLRLPEVFFDG